jgi:hypothetical protein
MKELEKNEIKKTESRPFFVFTYFKRSEVKFTNIIKAHFRQYFSDKKLNLESILPNYDFFVFLIFAIKLGHFKVHTTFSHATNTQG